MIVMIDKSTITALKKCLATKQRKNALNRKSKTQDKSKQR
jgi:hypothetical protein